MSFYSGATIDILDRVRCKGRFEVLLLFFPTLTKLNMLNKNLNSISEYYKLS